MLHHILMKASFETRDLGKEQPIPCPFVITDKSTHIPSDVIIETVEKYGNDVTLEKTLTPAEFHGLFRDVAKYVIPRPPPKEDGFVVGNPTLPTLVASSSRVLGAAKKLKAYAIVNQPREFVEAMASELPPEELHDFVTKEKTIEDLRKEFTIDGLQTFLLHFFKTYAMPDLPVYIKKDLKLAKKAIKWSVYNMANSHSKSLANAKHFHIDWLFPALGCFHQLYQFAFRNDSEYNFFQLKFRFKQEYGRYPQPHIPFCLSRLLPESLAMLGDLAELDEDTDINTRLYRPKSTKHEEFMMHMRALAESAWRGCHHEVFAYATVVLCNDDMLYHPYWKKYYFFVWGEMAVSLAKLNFAAKFSMSCLAKMKEFAEKCISFEIDSLLYEQKVASALRDYTQEEKCFKKILGLVSKHSSFYRNSIMVHMSSKKRQIEDILMKIFAYRTCDYDDFYRIVREGYKEDFCETENELEKEINTEKRLMHKFCYLIRSENKKHIFEEQLVLLRLYEVMLFRIKYSYMHQCDVNQIEANLAKSQCHEKHFMAFLLKKIDIDEYKNRMLLIKRELELQTKVVNHQVWANICFSHFLLLQVFAYSFETQSFLHDEAKHIYLFHGHPRAQWMTGSLINYGSFNFNKDDSVEPHCTIQWIIRNTPKVKQFIHLGIASAARFDVWLTHYDWRPMN